MGEDVTEMIDESTAIRAMRELLECRSTKFEVR
jgi:hypothetical protein